MRERAERQHLLRVPAPGAGEYGRTEGKPRGGTVWFGLAKDAVHGVTAVTRDGRKLPATLTRRMGAGLGLRAVEYPRGADVRKLVFTGAKGETPQRLPAVRTSVP
ncbi:hypothetical protein ACU635_29685 [[Actinomadura] parvosata]|uniref:hypothetical protein n=1 Tax=[Actinomadura] parvosata TaxID=1955412 RepID=UPI00406C7D1A